MSKVNADLLTALQVVMDSVDYTKGACGVTEMVGAVLPKVAIDRAHKAIEAAKAA